MLSPRFTALKNNALRTIEYHKKIKEECREKGVTPLELIEDFSPTGLMFAESNLRLCEIVENMPEEDIKRFRSMRTLTHHVERAKDSKTLKLKYDISWKEFDFIVLNV